MKYILNLKRAALAAAGVVCFLAAADIETPAAAEPVVTQSVAATETVGTGAETSAVAEPAAAESVSSTLARDGMTTVELTKLAEFAPPEEGAYVQGGTVIPSGYLMSFFNAASPGINPLLVLDTGSWQIINTVSAELSHANDLCYVPSSGEVFVLPMDAAQIIVLDAESLTVKRTIDTLHIYHAIDYDPQSDSFAAVYASGKGAEKRVICDILDNTCTVAKKSFPVDTNLTYQGLAVHDSRIYYTCWKKKEGNMDHKTVYDDLLQINDNVVYVYDFEGNLVDALLVKMPEGYNNFEIEAAAFSEDSMILQFNENLADENNTLMIGVYKGTWES